MKNGFEEAVYDAACMTMGEAVWQLVTLGEQLTPDTIAKMIMTMAECHDDLAASVALSVLQQA